MLNDVDQKEGVELTKDKNMRNNNFLQMNVGVFG
jgi:hypothetical protein